jgi:enoyl-[acyl-carrier protein] reductase II
MANRITSLFQIRHPIIQAGMVWCSGWELASAVSNAGGLGVIGSGSMDAVTLRLHIQKTKKSTLNPFGVNVPLLYSRIEESMNIIIEEKVPVVITSAGNPDIWTQKLKSQGIKVVHVVSNVKFARKAQDAGVDAIVAEGVEAGGHNGREETTTLTLIPLIRKSVSIPLIAAGGIATGRGMLAAMALGADGVQIGSRFVASTESSAHENFKNAVINTGDGGTRLSLKKITPTRLIRNSYCSKIEEAENSCATEQELLAMMGKGLSKAGMFDGDSENGQMEIGQVAALINEIKPAAQIIEDILKEYSTALEEIKQDPIS